MPQPQQPEPSAARGAAADPRRPQNPHGAEVKGSDPEAAQEEAEAAVPAGWRHEEAPWQEQTVALRGEAVRVWTGGSEKGEDEEETLRRTVAE